jgi:predicted DNA-binding transcriptional regulator YafY
MLSDDEALAVLLGLVAGRRAGLTTTEHTASETAAAKIRRVLPKHVAHRLDTLLEALAFTDQPGEFDTPDAGILLTVADAVRHRRPVSIRYTDREGQRSERTLHAYGIVAHAGRWYVTGKDARSGEDRTFRLDRVADARTLPGSFDVPEGLDPAQRVLSAFATAEYRHAVTLRIHGTVGQIRARLPASVASLEDCAPVAGGSPEDRAPVAGGSPEDRAPVAGEERPAERWLRVELRAERLDWLPPVLASLDRPFVIERPDELRDLVTEFADRLTSHARRT